MQGAPQGGPKSYSYDLAGNLIRGQDQSGVWQRFEYDAAGRLVKIMDDSSNVIETNTYGATRERLINTTSTGRTYYVWGGDSVVAEYTEPTSSSAPAYAKSYFYAGSRLLMTATKASSTTETQQFQHPDRLGTQLVTDGATGASFRQTTFPFGTTVSAETTGNSNEAFTTYDRSAVTGLDYAHNRTYSKGQSRFTQVDPAETGASDITNPQSHNLYSYTQNMPTDFVDPRGLNLQWISDGTTCVLRDGKWDCQEQGHYEWLDEGGSPWDDPDPWSNRDPRDVPGDVNHGGGIRVHAKPWPIEHSKSPKVLRTTRIRSRF